MKISIPSGSSMLDGSGHRATEVFDIGAQPDNMRSIPYKQHIN